ncbi:hypothetical protein L6164_029103 [Bauhinia variegata]|uniref:Uncharacterized protein n=1 Tax=Bauhinia variegata TaxID=167791 RepID=A0ACB9L7N1_BAUVA|nr:hypothetical protein L6164_029103 [Bauhinia variegata]
MKVKILDLYFQGKLNPLEGKEKLVKRVVQILRRRNKHSPCFIGHPGVWKTAIIEGHAKRIPRGMVPERLKFRRMLKEDDRSFGGTGWAITEFSWDVKFAGLQVIASKFLIEEKHKKHADILEQYRSKAEYYLCSLLNKNDGGNNVERTPAGLLYIRQWNNMQYVSTATFLLTIYSDFLHSTNKKLSCNGGTVNHDEILSFAKSQVDYILGSNPLNMSYLVGYGSKFPQRVHHRGASIVSYREHKGFIGCTQGYDNWYSREGPNPNILVGALVGGPDNGDNFEDRRGNYMQTEACTYNTAPLVGVFAKLLEMENQKLFHDSNSLLVSSFGIHDSESYIYNI